MLWHVDPEWVLQHLLRSHATELRSFGYLDMQRISITQCANARDWLRLQRLSVIQKKLPEADSLD
jgi:hypothetical protein